MKKRLLICLALLSLVLTSNLAKAGGHVSVGFFFDPPVYYVPPRVAVYPPLGVYPSPLAVYPPAVFTRPLMIVQAPPMYGYYRSVGGGCGSYSGAYYGPPVCWGYQSYRRYVRGYGCR
jgi:hypothetical protein